MKHCPHTTRRMIDFIFANPMRRIVFGLMALAPSAATGNADDSVSLEGIGVNLRNGSHAVRRAAKATRAPERHEFAAIGSLDRVDWTWVAHAIMYSIDPVYASDHDEHVASSAAMN